MKKKKNEKLTVLFVCTGNTCRSCMAEQLFARLVRRKKIRGIKAESAGIYASSGDAMTDQAIGALKRRGLKPKPHSARLISAEIIEKSDIIVCMTQSHRITLLASAAYSLAALSGGQRIIGTAAELIGEDISDPYGRGSAEYDKAADSIESMFDKLFEAISEFKKQKSNP